LGKRRNKIKIFLINKKSGEKPEVNLATEKVGVIFLPGIN